VVEDDVIRLVDLSDHRFYTGGKFILWQFVQRGDGYAIVNAASGESISIRGDLVPLESSESATFNLVIANNRSQAFSKVEDARLALEAICSFIRPDPKSSWAKVVFTNNTCFDLIPQRTYAFVGHIGDPLSARIPKGHSASIFNFFHNIYEENCCFVVFQLDCNSHPKIGKSLPFLVDWRVGRPTGEERPAWQFQYFINPNTDDDYLNEQLSKVQRYALPSYDKELKGDVNLGEHFAIRWKIRRVDLQDEK
jgi:hypothetical protein